MAEKAGTTVTEGGTKAEAGTAVKEVKKKTFISRFLKFLMYGGWMLVLIFLLGMYIWISYLFSSR